MRGGTKDWSWSSRPARPLPTLAEIREIPRQVFDTIDSTNAEARRLLDSSERLAGARVLAAQTQTGGVGRFGRRWASPRGGLWCTLLWPIPDGIDSNMVMEGLGLRIGVAVWETVALAV